MELNKDRGPIFSRYDRDRSPNYSPVTDYADHGPTGEEMAFILAHKMSPGVAEPGDMAGGGHAYQEGSASLRSFLQLLAPTSTQNTPGHMLNSLDRGQQAAAWSYQHRNPRRTQAQSKAALIGIIIWFLFILAAMLMSVLPR